MKVNPVQLLAIKHLHINPDNPKRPSLNRVHSRGLEASLREFGFSGIFNVARNADGSYEVLDGNSRVEMLDADGVTEAPCIIHDSMEEGQPEWREKRKMFALSYDRNHKLFDENAVLVQLRELAAAGQDVRKLSALTATENLKRLLEEQGKVSGGSTAAVTIKKAVPQSSLMLYGATEDIEAIRALVKRLRGRLSTVQKLRTILTQTEDHTDLTDEQFLLCFAAAVERWRRLQEEQGEE